MDEDESNDLCNHWLHVDVDLWSLAWFVIVLVIVLGAIFSPGFRTWLW